MFRPFVSLLESGSVLALTSLLCMPARAGVTHYQVTPIPTLGGPANSATAINGAGQVTGASKLDADPGGDSHAYVWDSVTGALTDLGTLGGSDSVGYAINDAGQVAGYSFTLLDAQRAFLWDQGVMTDILGAGPSASWAINTSGTVVGHNGSRAFVWTGAITDPGSLGFPTRAYGVNSANQVVGESGLRAFWWGSLGAGSAPVMLDLGTLPGGLARARARDINDAGQVVGEANFGSSDLEDYHAVLWENLAWDATGNYIGDVRDLGALPGGQRSFAQSINSSGVVVGYASSSGIGAPHAFVWDDALGLRDLNDLVPPNSGWTLQFAMDVNDSGRIVGFGFLNGMQRGFLLTPVIDGDVDGDGDVDLTDLAMLLSVFNTCAGDPGFDPAADFDGSGCVDLSDLAVLLSNFGA